MSSPLFLSTEGESSLALHFLNVISLPFFSFLLTIILVCEKCTEGELMKVYIASVSVQNIFFPTHTDRIAHPHPTIIFVSVAQVLS